MIVGAEPEIHEDNPKAGSDGLYNRWLNAWDGWRIGFSHFVDLRDEPTESVLWKMLDRRAAGIFPRTQKGADLIIPMFCNDEVSFILIKVTNRVEENERPESILQKLSPLHLFKEGNPLRKIDSAKMIRLNVILCDESNACGTSAQSVVIPSRGNEITELDCALYIRGPFAPHSDADNVTETRGRWSFLSAKLIKQSPTQRGGMPRHKLRVTLPAATLTKSTAFRAPLSRKNDMEVASKTLDLFSPS
ncbi:hypothetical protein F443_21571 [Phytophthora nicotianae P1569]|uniref:Uncharacterized protein n=1 Tax=Phytophthora nicotianae P1569 TaxID=1317065 RepID=V9DX41_PHYNI|nr:hypothetical protein F443_21571 [Phytophthora nicotianae P1569]